MTLRYWTTWIVVAFSVTTDQWTTTTNVGPSTRVFAVMTYKKLENSLKKLKVYAKTLFSGRRTQFWGVARAVLTICPKQKIAGIRPV